MSMIGFDDLAQHFATGPEATQTQRYRAYIQVVVDGKDMTNRLDPYLMSVLVQDQSSWTATIELDDRDGRLDIPPIGSSTPLQISMGWTTETAWRVFIGWITEIEHGFARKGGGRRMYIKGQGAGMDTKIKEHQSDHIGDGAGPGKSQGPQIKFADAAKQFGANVGLTASIGATFLNTGRDYWSMNNESVMQWFSRHASELGAWWRIEGNKVVFNAVGDFDKATIMARWGDNLIRWRIRPYAARSAWAGGQHSYFEDRTGKWLNVLQKFGLKIPWVGANSNAIFKLPVPAPNAQVAGQINLGDKEKANWMAGEGHVIINGEPKAAWGGKVVIEGARPGVDGTYFIESADHAWSRQGYVTTLTVRPDTTGDTSTNIGSHGYGPTLSQAQEAAAANALAAKAAEEAAANAAAENVLSIVHNPDGTTTTYFKDGTITTDGTTGITNFHPDGSTTTTPPPTPPISQPSPPTTGNTQTLPPVIVEPPISH